MLDSVYEADFAVLYPMTIVLIAGAAEVGAWLGRRLRRTTDEIPETGTLTGAALGLLALLLAFSFSLALSRYEARRNWVLKEANAIGSISRSLTCYAPTPSCGSALAFPTIRRSWSAMLPARWNCRISCGSRPWR